MAAGDFALPLAIVGAFLFVRELKDFELPAFPVIGGAGAVRRRTEELQAFEEERTLDAIAIEAKRAATELQKPQTRYGTVLGHQGAFTGTWSRSPGKPGDSCNVLYATPRGSNTTRYFTGRYCRAAAEQGLIEPFGGGM